MFDFSKIAETITGLVGGAGSAAEVPANALEMLQSAGIDPSALAGLSQDQILEVLSSHGLDPAILMDGQVQDILAGLGLNEGIAGTLAGLWGGEGGGGRE
jgi:hypothetical protein